MSGAGWIRMWKVALSAVVAGSLPALVMLQANNVQAKAVFLVFLVAFFKDIQAYNSTAPKDEV